MIRCIYEVDFRLRTHMTYFTALMGFFVYSSVMLPMPAIVNTSTPTLLFGTSTVRSLEASAVIPRMTQKELSVSMTAYNALAEQTDSTPDITGSGAFSNPEVIAARSADLRDVLPYGTIIKISADDTSHNCNYETVEHLIGYRVVADAMNPRIKNHIDVLLDEEQTVDVGNRELNPARALGRCEVTISVVGTIGIKDIPDTQSELRALVESGFLAYGKI